MSKSPSKEPETAPLVAIVIPMKDEADNLPGLFEEIDQALTNRLLLIIRTPT